MTKYKKKSMPISKTEWRIIGLTKEFMVMRLIMHWLLDSWLTFYSELQGGEYLWDRGEGVDYVEEAFQWRITIPK